MSVCAIAANAPTTIETMPTSSITALNEALPAKRSEAHASLATGPADGAAEYAPISPSRIRP